MENGFGGLLDSLYSRLILRDLFGKIGPGMLVLISAASWLDPGATAATGGSLPSIGAIRTFLVDTGGAGWLLLLAAAWLVSLGMQSLGEVTRLIVHWPRGFEDDGKRYQLRARFSRVATSEERQQAERYAVISEAAGLTCVACSLLAAGLIAIWVRAAAAGVAAGPLHVLWLTLLVLAALLFRRSNLSHVRKRYRFMTEALPPEAPTHPDASPPAGEARRAT